VGIICLVLVGAYVSWVMLRKTPIRIREWEFSAPSAPLSLCQIALSCVDWALAASVCYVLLPSSPSLSYPGFLGLFLLAQVIALAGQVPSGLGVLETVLLLLLSPTLPTTSVAASLVAYRAIYYILPLGRATVLLAGHEMLWKRQEVRHMELSHFLGSIVGIALLLLAWGLQRRLECRLSF